MAVTGWRLAQGRDIAREEIAAECISKLNMAKNSKGARRPSPKDLNEDELLLEALGRLEEEFPTGESNLAAPEKEKKDPPKKKAKKEVEKPKPAEPAKVLPEKTSAPSFPAAPTAAAVAAGLRKIESSKTRAANVAEKTSAKPEPSPERSPLESAPAGAGLTRIVPTREMPAAEPTDSPASAPGVVPLPNGTGKKMVEPKPGEQAPAVPKEKLPDPPIVPTGPPEKDIGKSEGSGGTAIFTFILATGAALLASWYILIPEYFRQNPPLAASSAALTVVPEVDANGEPTLIGLEKREIRDLREQLEILKARNRLTFLADRAISEAERSAYFELRQMLTDPDYDRYRVSINTEIARIDRFYMDGTRLGNRPLPVDELFPVGDAESEAELTTAQLISLLNERSANWQYRARAANLLGIVGTEKALEALALAAGTETNLDALKEIIYSFEESTGYRGPYLFDTESLFEWWVGESARRQEEEAGKAPLPQ